MFRLKTPEGRELKVTFSHLKPKGDEYFYPPQAKAITFCYITNGDGIMKIGHAYCSQSDNFDRKVGRKIALTRAVRGLDKGLRTQIWNTYLGK